MGFLETGTQKIFVEIGRKAGTLVHEKKNGFVTATKLGTIFFTQPKILLQQPNVLLIELNVLLMQQNIFVIHILTMISLV